MKRKAQLGCKPRGSQGQGERKCRPNKGWAKWPGIACPHFQLAGMETTNTNINLGTDPILSSHMVELRELPAAPGRI